MSQFLQAVAGSLIAVVICLAIQKQGKDIALLLTMGVCAIVMAAAVGFLKPVIEFASKLGSIGDLDEVFVQTILKAVGIALIAELTEVICTDSGNASLGKSVQFLAGAVILWLSLPVFTSLIDLVQKILEGI